MIKNKDRSGWFGASDIKFIMGNWRTSTFMDWWQTKLGTKVNSFSNVYTLSGSYKEHQIANYYAEKHKEKIFTDRQIKIRKYRLRVNLDCETKNKIVEIKTHKQAEKQWQMPKEYEWQVWVQMFATKKRNACIYAYGMTEEDYENFWLEIDDSRIEEIPITYNESWVQEEMLPRLVYLCDCLKKKKTPNIKEFKGEN